MTTTKYTKHTKKAGSTSILAGVLFVLSAFSVVNSSASSQRIYATVQLTNNPAQSNVIVIAGQSRQWLQLWTNNTATAILLTNNVGQNVTNLFQETTAFPLTNNVVVQYGTNTNSVVFVSGIDQALSVTFDTNNWAYVTYQTNPVYAAQAVAMPFTIETPTNRQIIASSIVDALINWPTNLFPLNTAILKRFNATTNLSDTEVTGGGAQNGMIYIFGQCDAGILCLTWPPWNLTQLTNWGIITQAKLTNTQFYTLGTAGSCVDFWPGTNTFGARLHGTNFIEVLRGITDPLRIYNADASSFWDFTDSGAVSGNTVAARNDVTNIVAGYAILATGGTGYNTTLSNLLAAVRTLIVTNLNAPGAGTVTITNAQLAVVSETVTNQNVLQSTITNANGAFVSLAATNLQAYGGSSSNLALTKGFLTNNNIYGTIYPARANTGLANGNNAGVVLGTNTYIRLSGATTIATIAGFAAETDGATHKLTITGAATNILANQSGIDPVAANRIVTGTGADITLINNPATVELIYDGSASRWQILNYSK